MTHYVFLKYKEGYFNDETFKQLAGLFKAAVDAMPEFTDFSAKKNILPRDVNMDLMISFKAPGPEYIPVYVKSDLHMAAARVSSPNEVARFSFDCED